MESQMRIWAFSRVQEKVSSLNKMRKKKILSLNKNGAMIIPSTPEKKKSPMFSNRVLINQDPFFGKPLW